MDNFDNEIKLVTEIVTEFYDVSATAVAKEGKIIGVALGVNIFDSYLKSLDCDPVNSIGAVFGFSQTVDEKSAVHLQEISPAAVVSTNFSQKASEILSSKTKVIKLESSLQELKSLEQNPKELSKDTFKIITKTKPTAEQIEDAVFAWKVSKYTVPNSAVIAKDFSTKAIAEACDDKLSAIESALDYACDGTKNAVLVCNGALTQSEAVRDAAQGRIGLIVHSGGTPEDARLAAECDKFNIAVITTGV